MDQSRRKESLKKLTSPEQLDKLLVIIRLPGWIVLLSLLVLILAFLVWMVFGSLPITVTGTGILYNPQSIELIQSEVEGFVQEIKVNEGDVVEKGQPLITINDLHSSLEYKNIQQQIQSTEKVIELERKNTLAELNLQLSQNQAIYELQKKHLKEIEKDPSKKREVYELNIAMEKQELMIALLKEQLAHPQFTEKLQALEWNLLQLKQRERDLTNLLKKMVVRAPTAGKVLNIEVLPGEEFPVGKNLVWFEKKSSNEGLIYGFFPVEQGEQIKPGMKVHIGFYGINTAQNGKIEGVVKRILPFGGGKQGPVLKSIPSPALREFLSKNKAAIVVEVEPILAHTPSGYKWTSASGPPFNIHPASLAELTVFLEEKRPIAYLFPYR